MVRTHRFVALVAVLLLACPRVEAQDKPFKVTGEGTALQGLSLVGGISPYAASGTATHLGKYKGIGIAQVIGFDEEPKDMDAFRTGTFTGGFVFVAANGDQLVCQHPGKFAVYATEDGFYTVFDAMFSRTELTIEDMTYTSTGRFANVTGGFRMIATTEAFTIDEDTGVTSVFDFEWHGAGVFGFPKP